LEPQRRVEQIKPDFATGDATPIKPQNQTLIDDAIAYYQVASEQFKHGLLAARPSDATPVPAAAASLAAPAGAASIAAPGAQP
jgi:hypothetical protein